MEYGVCRLCRRESDLHRSHIFPAGLYKRFVSDLARGGGFLSLREGRITNQQFVRVWFCTECEARLKQGEDAYYALLQARPTSPQYDKRLYDFAVSISWRCALFYFEESQGVQWVESALECWRRYLLNELADAEPYSQLMASLESPSWKPWNQGLGGFAMPNLNLVLSLVGPFVIFGLSRPRELTQADIALLEPARLLPGGGQASLDDSVIESLVSVDSIRIAMSFLTEASSNRIREMNRMNERKR